MGIVKFMNEHMTPEQSFDIGFEFRRFQHESREAFWRVQGDRIIAALEQKPLEDSSPSNFLERVISASKETSIGFAKHLCIAPTVLTATLNGRRKKLPSEILGALVEAGWPVEQIFNTGVRV